MSEWGDDIGNSMWARARCSNDECGHTQDVRVVVQYGCVQYDREVCDDCGAALVMEGE